MKQANKADCFACGKKLLSKAEIGLNKKMLGRKIKQFYCLDCFAEYLDISTEELLAIIEEFKEQGCTLF
ncbi:MAG: hypothetical protein MJA84_16870 [Firmicutes bacterium]|nr:hypothetical protein [Bacillota bacterium]